MCSPVADTVFDEGIADNADRAWFSGSGGHGILWEYELTSFQVPQRNQVPKNMDEI